MAVFPICLFLLVYALLTSAMTTTTTTISLSSELTKFIPACAQTCFISFIEANFPTTICSNLPTLDCLCSHNSTSGYTIGEGAVQCILSEDEIGFCNGADAKAEVVVDAFNMCNGQSGALPNTHGTITATLEVETASPSIVIVAPYTTATTVTTIKSNFSSTSQFSSIMSSTSASSSSTSSTAILATTASPSQVTPAKSTASITTSEVTSPSLSGPQIAGVTVGAVGGAAVAVGALILCACLRRRRKHTRDSDMIPFQPDPVYPVDSMKYNPRGFLGFTKRNQGPGGTVNGVAGRVTPPQRPPRLDTGSPNIFSRRSIRPDTIGLAISPETQETLKPRQRSSKLLPEKPVLTLQMPPQAAGNRFSQRQSKSGMNRRSAFSRASTGTQFEEDIDSAFAPDDTNVRGSTDKILDNATGIWKPQQPPLAANQMIPDFPMPSDTRAFHGQPPNTKSIIPDYYIRPLEIGRSLTPGSFSKPRLPDKNPQRQLQQLEIPSQEGTVRPIRTSSSIYSTHPSLAPSEFSRSNPSITSYHPLPRKRNSYKQPGPYDTEATDPISAVSNKEPRTAGTDLSPVVESPTGRSPVNYPQIPKLLSPTTIRMVPPPPQPDFSQVFSSGRSTVRLVPPEKSVVRQADMKPWRQAEIAAQQARMQNQRNQSQKQEQRQQQYTYQSFRRPQPQLQQKDTLAPSAKYNYTRNPTTTTSSSDTLPTQTRQPTALEAFNAQHQQNQTENQQNQQLQPPQQALVFGQRTSSLRTTSSLSTASSLLAKRRGSKQAANLTLQNKWSEEEARRNAAKWRVLRERDIEAAKSPEWRPQLLAGRDLDRGRMFERTELPNTPGWVPKLTPTRRGDELFLSVQ